MDQVRSELALANAQELINVCFLSSSDLIPLPSDTSLAEHGSAMPLLFGFLCVATPICMLD
jgi:hypothetical protein